MKFINSVLLACAIAEHTHAWLNYGGLEESSENYRPRVSEIISHLEMRNLVTWEDHELGNGVKVAVYHMQDWQDAKQYLAEFNYNLQAGFDYSNDTLNRRAPLPSGSFLASLPGSSVAPAAASSFSIVGGSSFVPIPSATPSSELAPQISSVAGVVSGSVVSSIPEPVSQSALPSAPVESSSGAASVPVESVSGVSSIPVGSASKVSSIPIGSGSAVAGTIGPDPPPSLSAAATSTTGASGTSSVPMADNTNHVTKWICNQPFNAPAQLGESALAAIICQYIFPFFQSRATGNQDTLVQRTMQLPPQADPANPGRFAQVLIHVEKNGLWPALKTILCSSLITQVVNNAYCWAYGKKFSLDPSALANPQPVPGCTAGGVIYIYASDGVTPAGLFEMDVVEQ